MKYHDYHLRGYSVGDYGKTIRLDLVWPGADQPERVSEIAFSGVAFYSFKHSAPAIITNIDQVPISEFMSDYGTEICQLAAAHGITGWRDTLGNFSAHLNASGVQAWYIDSAIGFSGVVLAQAVS